jgi:hypothetical protein
MGYSATLLSQTVEPDHTDPYGALILEADRLPQVWSALEAAEQVLGDHISWCERLPSYTGSLAERIAKVLHSYGWEDTSAIADDVRLGYWGGDKLGSCWDEVTRAIAAGIDPALTVTWIMCGEDSELWSEILEGGTVRSTTVSLVPNREILPEDSDAWQDDPDYPSADWRQEVASDSTRRGYRDWVTARREQDAS